VKLCLATASSASQAVAVVAERTLTHTFTRFTEAAESLSRSYHQLELEVTRPRQELEERTKELARSLEENRRIKASMKLLGTLLIYSFYLLFLFAGHSSKQSAESGL
jgi:vacuolar-type H+-ATPase subunit B/Vma2